jgi:hypothetical protein
MTTSAAVSLLSSSARSGSGSGSAVDLVEKTTAILYLDVTAITAGALTVTVQTSPNGTSGWTTVSPGDGAGGSLVFTAASAVGLQKVTFPGCSQYVRASWSVSGGGTATFAVTGSAYLVFSTPADLLSLGLRAEALSDVSHAVLDGHLRRATDEIVSSLAAQEYLGPFTVWGDDVAGTCRTLGGYYALLARGFKPADGADPSVQAVADARAWLDLVAKGHRKPFNVTDSTPTTNEGAGIVVTSANRGWLS